MEKTSLGSFSSFGKVKVDQLFHFMLIFQIFFSYILEWLLCDVERAREEACQAKGLLDIFG